MILETYATLRVAGALVAVLGPLAPDDCASVQDAMSGRLDASLASGHGVAFEYGTAYRSDWRAACEAHPARPPLGHRLPHPAPMLSPLPPRRAG